MIKKTNEHVCKICGKKLLPGDRFSLCLRCKLIVRKKVGTIGLVFVTLLGTKIIIDRLSNNTDEENDENE